MHSILFLKGLAVGFIVSMPLGPMAVICIRRTLRHGYLQGMATSFGIATADAIYACIASFSVNYLIDQIKEYKSIIGLFGGIVITILGVILFLTHSKTKSDEPVKKTSLITTFYTSILLTLSNPSSLLAFVALFSWIGARPENSIGDILLTVCGVSVGAIIWFNFLSLIFFILRTKLTHEVIEKIHKTTSIVIIFLGISMISSLLFR